VVEVRVQALREAAQGEGLAHAGACGEQADTPGVLQVVQPGRHLRYVLREETVLLFGILLIERIEGKPIVGTEHQPSPPIFE
jgi:hypothetical protein